MEVASGSKKRFQGREPVMTNLVSDYMNTKTVSCNSKASIIEVAKTMTQWNISSVAITDEKGDKVIGILTERDIVKSIAKGVPSGGVTAGSLMSAPVVSVKSDLSIEEAARLMLSQKVRHLLVEDASRRVKGIITTTDLARYLKQKMATATRAVASEKDQSDQLLSEVWELFF